MRGKFGTAEGKRLKLSRSKMSKILICILDEKHEKEEKDF